MMKIKVKRKISFLEIMCLVFAVTWLIHGDDACCSIWTVALIIITEIKKLQKMQDIRVNKEKK